MLPVAAILNDAELDRLLTHLGLPPAWPKTVPARSRPPPEEPAPGEESQANPLACIAGAVAEAFYGGVPPEIERRALSLLDEKLTTVVRRFMEKHCL